MKRVLITGGTGFVGANLVRDCIQNGHEVHLLLREGYADWRISDIQRELRLHVVDMAEQDSVDALFKQVKPEWVFHLAAAGAYSWQKDWRQMVETNLTGTGTLLAAFVEYEGEAFINAGSSSEYGYKDHAPQEDEAIEPNSYYSVTKSAATHLCQFTAVEHDVHVVTLRLYSVYGPYEDPRRLMPTMVMKGFNGELPPLVNPDIARDFIYADDVVDAFKAAAMQSALPRGTVLNIGTGQQTTLRDVVEVARQAMDIKQEPDWGSMPDRAWDTTVWVANNQKALDLLDWIPQAGFKTGFSRLVEWFRSQPDLVNYYATVQSEK